MHDAEQGRALVGGVTPRATPSDLALVGVAAGAFATASPLGKAAAGVGFGPMAAGRCALAAVVLLAATWGPTRVALRSLGTRARAGLVVAGVLLAGHFALFLGGLLSTSLAAAAALVSLEPLAVVVAAWIAFRERPTRAETLGLALATAGAVVVGLGAGQGEHRLLGDALVLGAVVLFGAYVAFARGLRATMPPAPYAACVYAVAAIALGPLALAGAGTAAGAPGSAWLAVLGLGLVPTMLGHTTLQRAARHAPAAIVALACPGETVGSILIGAVTGHAPTAVELAGAGIVTLGACVAILGTR